jgi:RNA-binding protein
MGHHLEPVVYVGKEGFSPALLKSTENALKAHELIKIKLGQNCPVERNEAGSELARLTGAILVQLIGRMILLYRPNPDLPEGKRLTV